MPLIALKKKVSPLSFYTVTLHVHKVCVKKKNIKINPIIIILGRDTRWAAMATNTDYLRIILSFGK